MKSKRTPGILGAALLSAAAVVPAAMAADLDRTSNWYVGANIGQSRATIDDERIIGGLLGSGLAAARISDDNRSTGGKLFAGYQLSRNFALEGGYFNLGRFGYQAALTPAGSVDGKIRLQGVNLDLVGSLPLSERVSVFGRVGAAYAQARDHFSSTGAVHAVDPDPRKNAVNVKFGAGLQYDVSDNLSMRAEAERYRINDAVGNKGDIDLYSVGLVYRFGQKSPVPMARSLEPQPVVVAAAPLPPPAPVAPVLAPAVPVRVSFAADSLFDFDRAIVKPAGRAQLDKFITDLRGTQYDVIKVTGHTDRLGRHAYNLKLSAARAQAVKAYLVNTGGIAAASVTATGVNGAQPVTTPGQCVGNKPTPKLIACLQPDRRVDVEVSGTR